MLIIAKYIVRSIKEKKFRTFLILFSVIAASALCLSSSLISDSLLKMMAEKQKEFSGSADIVITAGENAESPYIDDDIIPSSYNGDFEYTVKMFSASGMFKNADTTVRMNLIGMDMEDVDTMNPVESVDGSDIQSFQKNEIIVSKNTAKKYGISVGDIITVTINHEDFEFKVAALVKAEGFFSSTSLQTSALIPRTKLEEIAQTENKATAIYIKVKKSEDTDNLKKELEKDLPDYSVKPTVSSGEVGDSTRMLSMVLNILLIIEVIISGFIIYSSFKVITKERIPEFGVFLSVGATKRKTRAILLAEGIGYGAVGGVIGCCVGIGILYGITKILGPQLTGSSYVTIKLVPGKILFSFLLAVVISLFSSFLPVFKASQRPIKEVLLNVVENKVKKKTNITLAVGIIMIVFTVAAPIVTDGQTAMIADVAAIGTAIVGLVLLIPYLSRSLLFVFGKVYALVLGDDAQVSVNNLKQNKSIMGNITFLTIGIACLFMITVVCKNVLTGILDTFENAKYDVYFSMDKITDDTLSSLLDIDGIKEVQPFYVQNGVEVKGSSSTISFLDGVEPSSYTEYMDISFMEDSEKLLNELGKGRNIILNKMHGTAYSVKRGDTITLKTSNGWEKYKVIGFMDTVWNGGNYCIIDQKYFKKDFDRKNYDYVAIKTDKNASDILDVLIDTYGTNESDSYTIETARKTILDGSRTMFYVLNAFSALTAVIGVFGIFNNIILSFFDRKRELAVMRSIGMSKNQIVKMLILEAVSVGILGSIFGILGGLMLIQIMQGIISAVMATIPMSFHIGLVVKLLLCGVVVTLAASVSTVVKSAKSSIIESLKYE